MEKKILLIAYYWPPGGGIAVRRWLGMANAFSEMGMDVHVLTIDPESASYQHMDPQLVDEVAEGVTVHHVKAFNPFKWVQMWMPKAVPGAGFSGEKSGGILGRILAVLRSHIFIPDPRRTWVRGAVNKGCELVDALGISTIVTTSPPQSVQLIGRGIKRARPSVQWLADFRDPWTDIFYYDRLGHSALSRRLDARLEKNVLTEADVVVTVSWGFRDLLTDKVAPGLHDKFHVVTNGMDFVPDAKSAALATTVEGPFRIVYTGTMTSIYAPEPLFDAMLELNVRGEGRAIQLDYYGGISSDYMEELTSKYDFIHFHGFVAQQEIGHIQRGADALFLVSPDVEKARGIVPGKLFEYMGSMRPIVFLGHPHDDVSRILVEAEAGMCLPRGDSKAVREGLLEVMNTHPREGTKRQEKLQPFIRRNQARRILELLDNA